MEGAAGSISAANKGWIRKTLKRKQRGKTRSAANQMSIQQWCHALLTPGNGYKILFTPAAKPANSEHAYNMEEIDPSNQIMKVEDAALEKEVVRFFRAALRHGQLMYDIELYRQPDGRVAVLDFDKVGDVKEDTVSFPPSSRTMPLKDALKQYYLNEEIVRKILAGRNSSKSPRSRSRSRSRSKSH